MIVIFRLGPLRRIMINFVFLSIPCTATYEGLKRQQKFPEDNMGVSNWVMRFPLAIYSADLHERHIFREGEVQVQQSTTALSLEQKWRYFVMTNSSGKRYYCTYQMFYEKTPLLRKRNSLFSVLSESYCEFYLPKCLVMVSQLPYFKLHVNLLKVHRQLRKKAPSISCSVNEQVYNAYLMLLRQKRQVEWDGIQVKRQGRTLDCPIQVAFDYYLQSCNSHAAGEVLFMEKASNRQVLHLYKLSSQTIYQLSYYFHLPLSANTLRLAVSAILQEKQIIFVSNNQNLNVMLIQTLMQMVLPFKWHYMFVPNLPLDMLQAAQESFMPYIVGIQKKHLHLLDETDRVVIDVDTDTCTVNTKMNQLPQSYQKYFAANSANKNYLEWEREVRINSIYFILELLSEGCQFDQMLRFTKEQKDIFISRLPIQKQLFYDEFLKKTMMFNKFVDDKYEQLYREIVQLLSLHPEHRKGMILHRFNIIKTQATNPRKYDNQKAWIRYYQKYNVSKRKYRYAVSSKSVSMTDMYKSTLGPAKHNESTTTLSTINNVKPNLFNRSTVRL